jgi:hypothetical protein
LAKFSRSPAVGQNLCKVNKDLYKQVSAVKNLAQATDAALAFYYESVGIENIEIIRDKARFAPLKQSRFDTYGFTLVGPGPVGFKEIPKKESALDSCLDALQAMNFTDEDIRRYTHIVFEGKAVSSNNGKNEEHPFVKIYRLHPADYSEIVTGYF